ncbi:serine/threonine protein phosphatase-like protein 7 [Sarcoptes scabiei]|uniref:Serine/threonine-protein phosphatase n=1 Tax=Sarcoptes scabiei TaxID=52283 RepID=A0A132A8E0_SARSC|nr:serine/threonine protein phosphatase-like protein 7 [Sarcoptes scabiei]
MTSIAEREQLLSMFRSIYDQLLPMLESEKRIKSVNSPCFIVGDIHGNLEDLISLETTIWKRFPCQGVHYLFLGDYVDRGRWSIECILYLFAMKSLMPKGITLLRGNHEIREIQTKYTYRRELLLKYGNIVGKKLWDLTNQLFDRLPLCAVIDERIYCAHGGIPHQSINLNEINSMMPSVIVTPEFDSQLAWEIMWSDPIAPEHFQMVINMYPTMIQPFTRSNTADGGSISNGANGNTNSQEEKIRDGYLPNTKRGTAFYFNDRAIENFFQENHLSYVVRAHEVPKLGFMFHFENKCITIFSCSHYCGNENDCAVLFANHERIRIIRIDTTANASATDDLPLQ